MRKPGIAQPPALPEQAPPQAEASQAARTLVAARWKKTTPAQRQQLGRWLAAQRSPAQMGAAQRSGKPRCPCGEMTLKRALARRHKCVAPKPPETAQPRKKTA